VKHLLLIDASSYIFRAFHALPPLARADGTPVNAVLGFLKMVKTLTEKANADHQAVIFDARRRTFRNDIYAEYKAKRSPTPDDLVPSCRSSARLRRRSGCRRWSSRLRGG
jgi:DNA polymerase-1